MPIAARFLLCLTAAALLSAALAACSPLSALNALTPSGAATRHDGIAYGSHPRQRLDVYLPEKTDGKAPVVVFFYGGSWNTGSRGDYAFVGEALAGRGIVTVIADYRLYPEVRYPEFLHDSAMAVAWALEHAQRYGGDPERVFVMGHSAGAYNAAMVALDERWLAQQGTRPGRLRGWIGLAGPYDFLPIDNPDVQPVFHHPDTPPSSQPIRHVGPGAPPALLIAARSDDTVNPQRNTAALAQQLGAAGVPVQTFYFNRVGHATLIASLSLPLRTLAPVLEKIEGFVKAPPR